jgi:hypothetical protein
MSQLPWQDAAAALLAPGGTAVPDAAAGLFFTRQADRIDAILGNPAARERIGQWADLIETEADRETFGLFAYSPAAMLTRFASQIPEMRRWSSLVELYEAWSQLAAGERLDIVEERGRSVSLAYFTRTRWLLLSLPFRAGADERISPLDRNRIDDGSGRIVTLALQARDDWLAVLGRIDDFPRLKRDIDVEGEAEALATLEITRARLGGTDPGPDMARPEVMRYAVGRLLLPRFALPRVWRIVWGSAGWTTRLMTGCAALLCTVAVALLLAGLAQPSGSLLTAAAVMAVAWYGLLALAAAVYPPAAWLWLMRQPASAAVGMLGLVVIPPDWWHDDGHTLRVATWAAILLSVAGLGYLYLEASSHDVLGWRRAWRPAAVAAFGYLHAAMVSVIGLRFLLPEFSPRPAHPPYLSCWWHTPGCGPEALPAWLLLLVAASWAFAAGVFLQIIWDDQPVTAPLAHVSWRRES